MIVCIGCNINKPESDYYKNNKVRCKSCVSKASMESRSLRGRRDSGIKKDLNKSQLLLRLLNAAKTRAKSKNIPYDLDKDWVEFEYSKGVCAVTKTPLNVKSDSYSVNTPSIDQIHPSKGYTKENCRLVCYWYNTAKNRFTDGQVLLMCKAVVENSI